MDVKQYVLDNTSVISRLLPFFVRGKKTLSLLIGCAHPLISLHEAFKEWALERKIEAAIMGQIIPLEWYLNHLLNKYLQNRKDWIYFGYDAYGNFPYIYMKTKETDSSEHNLYYNQDDPAYVQALEDIEDGEEDDIFFTRFHTETNTTDSILTVNVPKIIITNAAMEVEVRKIVDRYLCHFTKYVVIFL